MTHAHERQQEDAVELIEDALVMGKLMEVDWTKRTARLERFREKPVKLRFGKELDEEMRRFATQYVQVRGKGHLKAPDTDMEEWVSIEVESVSLPYQSNGPKEPFRGVVHWRPDPASPDDIKEMEEFMKAIREAR